MNNIFSTIIVMLLAIIAGCAVNILMWMPLLRRELGEIAMRLL